jgi:hypothetical protein
MHAKSIGFGASINVFDYGLCATVHVSQLPNGTWDVSETFQIEWDEMVRELAARGYSPPGDEPTTSFSAPLTAEIVGEFEIYYLHRVAEYAQYDLTALESAVQPATV